MNLRILKPNDETVVFELDDKHLASLNYDEDGWQGMERAETILRGAAEIAGWTIEEVHGA